MSAPNTPPVTDPKRAKPAQMAIGLASLGRAVRRYSLLVFIFALLSAVAGALVYFFLPLPKNTGRMVYLVDSQQQHVLNPNTWSSRDAANFRNYQVNLLLGRTVLNVAMSEPGIASLPMFEQDRSIDGVQYLQTNLRVDWSTGSEHMRVTLEGNDPQEILMVLNAVDKAFEKEVVFNEHRRRHDRMEQLRNLQLSYMEKVKTTKANIRSILTTINSADPIVQAAQERLLTSMMGQSDAEMLRLHAAHRVLSLEEARVVEETKLPPALRSPPPRSMVEQYVESDPQIRELRAQLDVAMAKIKRYDGVLPQGAKPAPYVALETEVATLQTRLSDGLPKLYTAYEKQLKELQIKGEQNLLASIKNRLDMVRQQQEAVSKDVERLAGEMQKFKEQNAKVEDLMVEVTNNQSIATKISNDLVNMQTELTAPVRVSKWESAYVFPGIEGNRRAKYTAIAVLGFLVLGLALAQWLEIRHRRIQTLAEVTEGLGLQILGTVPAMPKGGVTAKSNWPHLLTEAVNTTRTMLLSGPYAESTKTLLVTSAMSGEGKTSLTTHLAVSLAGAGRRVLLIDADMRRPAVHKVLGLESKPGLAELLVGNALLDDVTQTCKIAGLHLVAAGVYSREAAAALSGETFSQMLKDASIGYDFVLVDSPPILPVSDALAISKNVDGVLISVMQDLSRYGAVQTACQRLNVVGANVLGVVVSGVKTTGGYYYYYYDERYSKPETASASAPEPVAEPETSAIVPATPVEPPSA